MTNAAADSVARLGGKVCDECGRFLVRDELALLMSIDGRPSVFICDGCLTKRAVNGVVTFEPMKSGVIDVLNTPMPYAAAREEKGSTVVPKCPYCGKEHKHGAKMTGIREAPCGRGRYHIVVSIGGPKEKESAPEKPGLAKRQVGGARKTKA